MKTQNTAAIRPVSTPITPDLNHRFVHLFHDHRDIQDTINIMASRALSVLRLLGTQFEDNESHTVCNETIYVAISSVEQELQDIRAYLKAFSAAQKIIKNPR